MHAWVHAIHVLGGIKNLKFSTSANVRDHPPGTMPQGPQDTPVPNKNVPLGTVKLELLGTNGWQTGHFP
jgi:hypothetical protein